MKLAATLAVARLFLFAAGVVVPREPKNVGCYYLSVEHEQNKTLFPEDIDAAICSHLMYSKGRINYTTEEIEVPETRPEWRVDGEGFLPRLVKLKDANPDLKLILLVDAIYLDPFTEPSRRVNLIKNGVKWLNESGFDGFQFYFSADRIFTEDIGDLFCAMKPEFEKYGYLLTAMFVDRIIFEGTVGNEEPVSKWERCGDHVTLVIDEAKGNRLAPMNEIKSNVDWYIDKGLSANKMKIVIPILGMLVTVEDAKEKGDGAKTSEPTVSPEDVKRGSPLVYKKLQRGLNDSSPGWTIRRNEDTGEAYAFSKTGLWVTYEDTDSLKFKARYVLEKDLAGMDIIAIEFDDDEGFGGEGRFPLTRAIYDTFRRHHESVDTTS